MLNSQEYLLTQLSEECAEVAHRASKAMRFGLAEQQFGQPSNRHRLESEVNDLLGTIAELRAVGILTSRPNAKAMLTKRLRIKHYMQYSREVGALEVEPIEHPSGKMKAKKKAERRYHWWKCGYCGDTIRTRYEHPPRRKHKCGREDWQYVGFK